MAGFLEVLDAIKTAVPPFVDTFTALMAALEYIALRVALLALMLYGLYRAVSPHRE